MYNYLTLCKQINSGSFKKYYLQSMCLQIIYNINKEDSALNIQQVLICHETLLTN